MVEPFYYCLWCFVSFFFRLASQFLSFPVLHRTDVATVALRLTDVGFSFLQRICLARVFSSMAQFLFGSRHSLWCCVWPLPLQGLCKCPKLSWSRPCSHITAAQLSPNLLGSYSALISTVYSHSPYRLETLDLLTNCTLFPILASATPTDLWEFIITGEINPFYLPVYPPFIDACTLKLREHPSFVEQPLH